MQHQEYSLEQIAQVVGGTLLNDSFSQFIIHDIIIDSRQLISVDRCVFFALVSSRNDGHKYMNDLYNKGLRSFVVSKLPENIDQMSDAAFILVKDTLAALQSLTAFHRKQFDIPVIGITGSNGKTIIKEWLFQLLSPDRSVIRSPKSYNSQIGVPLSVWQMNKNHQMAIFEAGISEPEEMEHLQAIIKPTVGLFTNIGQAHSENFIQTEQKVGEKLKLFTKVKTLVYCSDLAEIQSVIIRSGILNSIHAFTWSRKSEEANLFVKSIKIDNHTTTIDAVCQEKEISITIPFIDEASIENAIHCWSMMLIFGFQNEVIAQRMLTLAPIAMRLEVKSGINNCTIINDSYNSDVNSLTIALDFMNQQQQHKNKTLILSDILQSGRNEIDLYTYVAQLIESKGIDFLIGIGESIQRQANRFNIKKVFYPSTKDFLSNYPFSSFVNQTILLKGARIFEFERISNALQEKAHETILEINLNNLVSNLNYFRSRIKPETKLMVMVKAFGYGSGSLEVSNVLQFHHVDYLTVAYADEGVELRMAGITLPIMVMSPEENSFETMIKYFLEPEVFNFRTLDLLEQAIAKMVLPGNKPIKIHLKIDTGMHRLGFEEDDIDLLIEHISKNPMLRVQSVFSHLAAGDKPEHDEFTKGQIALFERVSTKIVNSFSYPIMRHILNTAGISRFNKSQFEMVRLGIGLYGVPSTTIEKDELQTVTSLKSTISQIKEIKSNESIGYNRHSFTNRLSKIGVVPIGYADGLTRLLGNRKGTLWVNDQPAPIIGDVCMDMCMIDVTDIQAQEGDTVVIFDAKHPITLIAEDCNTIPYEILTRISRRVKRIYFQE